MILITALPIQAQAEVESGSTYLGLYSRTHSDMGRPTAMAYGSDGHLWVADSDRGLILEFDSKGTPVERPPQFLLGNATVGGMAVSDDGGLWLSFPHQREVRHYGANSLPTTVLNSHLPNAGAGGFLDPRGLTLVGEDLWMADAGRNRLEIFRKGQYWEMSVGEGMLKNPQDVCVDSRGRILVTDTGNSRICAFSAEGKLLATFGEWGWFPGLFSDPTAIESHGERIYVADRENQRVQVFDLDGKPIYRIGLHAILPREGEGTLHYPTHLALRADGKQLALAEPMDGRVQVFGMGQGEAPPVKVNRPTDRQPAPHYGAHWDLGANYLAIPEPETHSIRIYDLRRVEKPEGDKQQGTPTLVTEVGGFGTELGQYVQPGGLFIGGDPLTLLACDMGNGRLVETILDLDQKRPLGFTLKAAKVHRALNLKELNNRAPGFKWRGSPRPVDVERAGDGTTFVLCDLGREVYVLNPNWELTARFGADKKHPWLHPVALAWDERKDQLHVCDAGSGQVHVYDREGKWVQSFGRLFLRRPFAVDFTPTGEVLVVDRQLCTLFTFDETGEFIRRQGFPGIDRDSFFGPTDVDVDERGRVYVLDHGNHRGMVFDEDGEWFHAFGSRLYTKPARLPETIQPASEEDSE